METRLKVLLVLFFAVALYVIVWNLLPGPTSAKSQPTKMNLDADKITTIEHQFYSGEQGAVNAMTEVRRFYTYYEMNSDVRYRLDLFLANAVLNRAISPVARYSALEVIDDHRKLLKSDDIRSSLITAAIGDPSVSLRSYAMDILMSE